VVFLLGEFDRVQAANRAALNRLGLVLQRGCDSTDLRCIDRATGTEEAAFLRAAAVERGAAASLRRGTCRTAILNRSAANSKRASLVRRARTAWGRREYQEAGRLYYRVRWAPRGSNFGFESSC
jgi:hypothetical protein